jgi:tetratricopeptide (TPR) repeat protein
VRAHFGDWTGASEIYRRELDRTLEASTPASQRRNPFWLMEMIAALELRAGNAGQAYAIYHDSFRQRPLDPDRGGILGRGSPYIVNRLAVAAALAGDRDRARELLDAILETRALPELLSSRAALRAIAADLGGAEADLRTALAMRPQLAAALQNQAWILGRRGDTGAEAMHDTARHAAARAPREFPYGAGDGRGLNTQRFMLVLENEGIDLYRPVRTRGARPSFEKVRGAD